MAASLVHIIVYMHQNDTDFAGSIKVNRVPFALVFYGILAAGYPLALMGYHLWLMARGETTREYITSQKFPVADRHRPYKQNSLLANWIAVLNRPRPPTYLRFKNELQAGDQRFGEKRTAAKHTRIESKNGVEMNRIRPQAGK
jgi:palmitoyltransferase ZDHHC9/14/18